MINKSNGSAKLWIIFFLLLTDTRTRVLIKNLAVTNRNKIPKMSRMYFLFLDKWILRHIS